MTHLQIKTTCSEDGEEKIDVSFCQLADTASEGTCHPSAFIVDLSEEAIPFVT
jgi:hypothetical protein